MKRSNWMAIGIISSSMLFALVHIELPRGDPEQQSVPAAGDDALPALHQVGNAGEGKDEHLHRPDLQGHRLSQRFLICRNAEL
jgi:hypothetical protein